MYEYIQCTIYLAIFFMIYILFFAHPAASPNNFIDNGQNRIWDKWKHESTDTRLWRANNHYVWKMEILVRWSALVSSCQNMKLKIRCWWTDSYKTILNSILSVTPNINWIVSTWPNKRSYLTACYLYQVMMTLHFLNDVAYDAESTQTSKIRHDS